MIFRDTILRFMVLAFAGALAAGNIYGQTADNSGDVNFWIEQLGADRFADRQAAMSQLIQIGASVIPPIESALDYGEPEMRIRGIAILQQLATSRDETTAELAQQTLTRLTASPDSNIARLAQQTVGRLGAVLQSKAIEDLQALGAEIPAYHSHRQVLGVQNADVNYTITIGPGWSGSKADLKLLQWIVDAYRVTLSSSQVDDEIVEIVSRNPKLNYLKLKDASITNRSMAHLADQNSLNMLEVVFCPIDNGSVEHLARMTNLSTLRLYGTDIDRPQAMELETESQMDVDYRLGAFLGVYYNRDGQACQLTDIVPGSAADEAGLQVGDIITSYNGTEIETSDDFQGIVSHNRPGDQVKVIVNRNGEEVVLAIELGRMMDINN